MDTSVDIQTTQIVKQEGMKDKFEARTTGVLQKRQATYLRFEETVDGMKVKVTVKIQDDEIKLIRTGQIKMMLHFVEGQETTTFYEVPGGKMLLTVKTRNILHFVDEHGGKLKIHYELFQDEEKMGVYHYELKYKEI